MADFYRAFEDKYRGSQASIKDRLRVYCPLIEKMKEDYGSINSLDLGCGRGEWMSLLTDLGVETFGIDIDDSMLNECRIRKFSVENADIISFLKTCKAESYYIITAFHVVEHIAFDDLCTVIDNAVRALKPGGILILETPNAENLIVGTNNFYLDPTHNKPIPALLLSFICEYYGLESNYIMRLQHPEGLLEKSPYGLYDVITGVSFDYAVIAQKKDINSIDLNFNDILGGKAGYNLEQLSRRYDKEIESKFKENERNQIILKEKITSLECKIQKFATDVSILDERRKHELAMAEKKIELIYNSNSWRYTAPLRTISSVVKKYKNSVFNKPKNEKKSFSTRIISLKEKNITTKIYYFLNKISPFSANYLKSKYNELLFKLELEKVQVMKNEKSNNNESKELIEKLKNCTHFELVSNINHLNMLSTDYYLNYSKNILKTDGFQHLSDNLPIGTSAWILKIKETLYSGEPLESIFPENIENKAAATALYIVLLKRLPENDIVTSKPIKHLCMVITQSEEYKKSSGDNLKNWCDL